MTEEDKRLRLQAANLLIEGINEAEKDDPELAWRPWRLVRSGDAHVY